jgi:hypothetical protein
MINFLINKREMIECGEILLLCKRKVEYDAKMCMVL